MAKRKAARRAKSIPRRGRRATPRRSVKRPREKRQLNRRAVARAKSSSRKRSVRRAARRRKTTKRLGPPPRKNAGTRTKAARLNRVRRTLRETGPTPPSSLNLDRHGSAVRTGRAGLAERLRQHTGMTPAITGGDVDADWENAYFSGDEAPGGDNPTPDQVVVDDIGKALGVQYDDSEELKSSDKVVERDKHRWELDPASSEDYKDRK